MRLERTVMVVVMKEVATQEMIEGVANRLEGVGFKVHKVVGVNHTILGAIGDKRGVDLRQFELMEGVHEVIRITEPYKLASRTFHPENSVINVSGTPFGAEYIPVMAGPCSVESEEQVMKIAYLVKEAGADLLRGGAFKPRSSPYSFQGNGAKALEWLKAAGLKHGLPVVSEVMEIAQIEIMDDYVDLLQVGARNMQNFNLLKELGKVNTPVLLKRGLSATIEEILMAAEYIMNEGNYNVIFCERGIRTFETITRNTLDLSAIPVVQKRSHLPIIVDPSHATGLRDKVAPMARAAVAAGADGLLIEVHDDPNNAMSDGAQSLYPEQFSRLMEQLRMIAWAIGRKIGNNSAGGSNAA